MYSSNPPNPIFPIFPLDEYQRNPEAVKRTNDAALGYFGELRRRIEKDEELLRKKEEKIARLNQIGLVDMAQPLFIILGSVIFAFGVNLATSSPGNLLGWVLSVAGCAIQLIFSVIGVIVKLRK